LPNQDSQFDKYNGTENPMIFFILELT